MTNGIPGKDVEKVGLRYAATASEALDMAFGLMGEDASVAVLRNAAEMLPIVDDQTGSI